MKNIIKNRGFSLLELMLVVAILGIMAAIAIPNYNSYIKRQNRELVKHNLKLIALSLESYKTEHKTFEKASLKDLGFESIDDKQNTYTILNLSSLNFTVTVVSKNDNSCALMSLNSMNQRLAQSTSGENTKLVCWQ